MYSYTPKNPCSLPLGMFSFVQHSLNVALILNMYVCMYVCVSVGLCFCCVFALEKQLQLKPLTAWMLAE